MKISVLQNESLLNKDKLLLNPGDSVKRLSSLAISFLLIICLAQAASAQNIRVRGHVTNETGQPVPKPSVLIKGTSNGVTGNDNGDFEIQAPGNATLVISSVGYSSFEVDVNNRTSVSASLTSSAQA